MQSVEPEVVNDSGQIVVSDHKELNVEDLIERFVSSQDVFQNSRETYKRELRQFMGWLQNTEDKYGDNRMAKLRNWELGREDILAYKKDLEETYSSYTVNSYLTAVRKFFDWLDREIGYQNPVEDVKGLKQPKGHSKDSLTPGQVREALKSIDRDSLKGKRDYALFNLMVRTGLRVIEIARAEVKDLSQKSGEPVLWIQGKGRTEKDDFVVLTPEAERPLRDYLSERIEPEAETPLFVSLSNRNYGESMTTRSISRVIKNILQDINLDSERFTAHSLRHTAITLAIQGGADLHQAQAMARHSDPKTTERYFHNLNRITEGAEKCIQI